MSIVADFERDFRRLRVNAKALVLDSKLDAAVATLLANAAISENLPLRLISLCSSTGLIEYSDCRIL